MALARHNGRSGKHGVYNPKHNDRSFDVENSKHIDEERAKRNIYWDCIQKLHEPGAEEKYRSFEEIEKDVYQLLYREATEEQNKRNERNRHPERNRTPQDLLQDKRTCPEETIYQIGNVDGTVPPEVLAEIAVDFFNEMGRRYGKYFHILDWSLHLDEATPHIHERHVFDCEDRYGFRFPQQEKALELMGIGLPDPKRPKGKDNNRKMAFDRLCRELLFEICDKHGLDVQRETSYGGRDYMEKQDYIVMRQKERIAGQEEEISEKETKLEELTIQIGDTEKFIDEVSETAYQTAVKAVTEKVIEETHNADFDEIEKMKNNLTSDKSGNSPQAKRVISQTLDLLMKKFRGLTGHISGRLQKVFGDPEQKKTIQAPIRESIRDQLARNKKRADEENAKRRAAKDQLPEKKQNIEH